MSAVREERISPQEALTGLLAMCINDPELFFLEILRVPKLRRWQKRTCDRIKARLEAGELRNAVLIRSAHGAGKTWFVAGLLVWFMFTRPMSRGLTTAPTWKQVEDTLWRDVAGLYNGSLLAGQFGRLLASRLELGGVWFASGVASDRMENVEGQHSPTATIRIVDEAKAVPDDVFVATKGIFTSPEILDVWISTPSIQSGEFYKRDVGSDATVIRERVDVDELITDDTMPVKDRDAFAAWKTECARDWGVESPEYQSRVMAGYVDNAEGALFPSSWIERAMAHEWTVEKPVIAALDVAGSIDGDQNAFCVVAGPDAFDHVQVKGLASWHERDTMVTKGRAVAAFKEAGARTLRVDVIGLGKGVADAARQDKVSVAEYRASDRARESDRFLNRKAEDAWRLRWLLEKDLVRLPNLQALKAELVAMRYEVMASGKLRVVDPSDSPDLADSVIIGCAGAVRILGFVQVASEDLGEKSLITAGDLGGF